MEKEYVYPAVLASGYDEDRIWVVNFVGLSGCWVEGEDKEDVIKRAPGVLKDYLNCCIQAKWPIPEPAKVEDLKAANVGEVVIVKCKI